MIGGEFEERNLIIIFLDFQSKEKYEDIIIPYIKKEIFNEFDKYEKSKEKIVILDAPTLIENNLQVDMDFVILVWVDNNTQIIRIKNRDKLSRQDILNRINAQIPLDRKRDYANIIIDNKGSFKIKATDKIADF